MLASLLLLALAPLVLADVDVQVGPDLKFSPDTVTAGIGERVVFHFHSTNSATQSPFGIQDPCHNHGGFDTGIKNSGQSQPIIITSHQALYVHSTPHCGAGMVMIVNPGPNDDVEKFRTAAIAQQGGGSSTTTATTTTGSSSSTGTGSVTRSTGSASSTSNSTATGTGSSTGSGSGSHTGTSSGSASTATHPTSGSSSGTASGSGSATGSGASTGTSSATGTTTGRGGATSSGAAADFVPSTVTMFLSSLLALLL